MDNLFEERYKIVYKNYYILEVLLSKLHQKLPTEVLEFAKDNYLKLKHILDVLKKAEVCDTSILEKIIEEGENNYFNYLDSLFKQDKKELLDLLKKTHKNNFLLYSNPSNRESSANELQLCIENLYNSYILVNIEPEFTKEELDRIKVDSLKDAIRAINNQLALISLKLITENDPILASIVGYEYNVYKSFYDIYSKELEKEENNKQEKSM